MVRVLPRLFLFLTHCGKFTLMFIFSLWEKPRFLCFIIPRSLAAGSKSRQWQTALQKDCSNLHFLQVTAKACSFPHTCLNTGLFFLTSSLNGYWKALCGWLNAVQTQGAMTSNLFRKAPIETTKSLRTGRHPSRRLCCTSCCFLETMFWGWDPNFLS